MSIESITQAANSSGKSGSALSSLSSDLDNFLKILTTQLNNQDPLSPMESNEFTNQLVAFANVEQNIAQSGYLEDLIALQKVSETSNAVSYMGKTVKVDHNEFTHDGAEEHELEYTLPEEAKTAAIFVMNKDGNIVYSSPVETDKGTHTFNWTAKDAQGASMAAGDYHFEVRAVDTDAAEIEGLKYGYTGTVDAVEYGAGSTTLKLGNISVDLGKVTAIVTPPAAAASS